MNSFFDLIIISIAFINILLAGSSRIRTCIRLVSVQGIIIGILPLIMPASIVIETLVFSGASIIMKGFVFPRLLLRTQQNVNVKREVEPVIGFSISMLICIALFLVSYWLSSRLPFPYPIFSNWIVPVSLATFLTGNFIIVTRTKAITQVLGYIVLENGIYVFGMALLVAQPLLVEIAILLDIFVAVFIMGIAIFHISRQFDHINTNYLSNLKDWKNNQEQEYIE